MLHRMDIVKLLNGYSIAAQIQISGIALAGLRCILRAAFGRTEIAEILLQYKAVVNAQDDAGRIPLHLVSKWEHVDFTRLLLEHGADVNSNDVARCMPLHLAYDRKLDIARLLVEHGANLDLEDFKGRTASQVASERGHHDFAKWLSGHGSK